MQHLLHFFVIFSKNNIMEWFYVCLIGILSLVILLFFPLLFSAKINFNLQKNLFCVKIKFFCFPIKTIKKNVLSFDLNKMKKHKIPHKFLIQFLRDIKIFNMEVFCVVGNGKIIKTLCFCGALNASLFLVAFFLKNNNGIALKYKVKPCFWGANFEFAGRVKIFFMPINFLFSIIKAKRKSILKKKGEKEKCKKITQKT